MNIRTAIVGQGAIASLFAYYWRELKPSLLLKPSYFENDTLPSTKSLMINNERVAIVSECQNISIAPATEFDVIVITVKAYQLPSVIEHIKPWLSVKTKLVLIQNGMGGLELLQDAFAQHQIYVGATTDAVCAENADSYLVNAIGVLDVGHGTINQKRHDQDDVEKNKWPHEFFSYHPNYCWHHDINKALFTKLAVNAVINPLTAKLGIKNGELTKHSVALSTIKTELFALFDALDLGLQHEELNKKIDKVIADTADNHSSMHQDVAHKRQTEIDNVLGYLLTKAQQVNCKVAFINSLYNDIKMIESNY